MKKLQTAAFAVLCSFAAAFFCGCSAGPVGGGSEKAALSDIRALEYDGVKAVADMNAYAAEVVKNGVNNDDPVENGIVKCPYYELEINGENVPVYTTRCANGLHSFAWVDAEKADGKIALETTLKTKKRYSSVTVLPESSGVSAKLSDDVVTAEINAYGSFSFAFDKKPAEAVTIYVAPKEELSIPDGWAVERLSPGRYTQEETRFQEGNTVYFFEKGRYELSSVYVPSDSIVYFEEGVYVDVYAESETDGNSALRSSGTNNIKILGRGLFDFSAIQGGDKKIKGVFGFHNVSEAVFSGIVCINSNSWSLCFTDSENADISRCMFLGYRTYSDGIMLSDCRDCTAKYCFLRTGDDAVETKSTGSEGTDNILYEYNAVWTDKANAYGAIYECSNDMKNVIFRNCSVGFAQPVWSPYLGVCVVQMGNNKNACWEDIRFENIEVFKNECALINITLRDPDGYGVKGGQAKNIYFENVVSSRCYGLPVRIYVTSGCKLGAVYLDGIGYNGKTISPADINDENVISVSTAINWSKKSNLKINTLSEE